MDMKLIIDVRTREEFIKKHVKGALNMPLHDIHFYIPFLSSSEIEEIKLYCDTGNRAGMAKEILQENSVEAEVMEPERLTDYEMEESSIVCAINFVSAKNGLEEKFESITGELCNKTNKMPGFLGARLLKVDGISARGSFLSGDMKNEKILPTKYIILTYWRSKEEHKASHESELFRESFEKMISFLASMPYEKFYEVVK